MTSCTLIIGGDVCPIGRNLKLFEDSSSRLLFGDLFCDIEIADCSLVNLECPLISKPSPMLKSGPTLGATSNCISALKEISVVNLANNHIMDHGADGLFNTISLCKQNNIAYVGAGHNLSTAGVILVREYNDIRIGLMGIAEHEFGAAGENTPGFNPLTLTHIVRNIKRSRDQYDHLIILLHGGVELYPYPSPWLRDVCHFLVEQGASAVVCQHSHCMGCYEEYGSSYIVYGQGNLIFDGDPLFYKGFTPIEWTTGILIRLLLKKKELSKIEFIPFVQSLSGIQKLDRDDLHFQAFLRRSNEIEDMFFVEEKWIEFCTGQKHQYLSLFQLPNSRIIRFLNRKYRITDWLISNQRSRLLLNLMRCESHREIMETILEESVKT